jgi:hypothetical protein
MANIKSVYCEVPPNLEISKENIPSVVNIWLESGFPYNELRYETLVFIQDCSCFP